MTLSLSDAFMLAVAVSLGWSCGRLFMTSLAVIIVSIWSVFK